MKNRTPSIPKLYLPVKRPFRIKGPINYVQYNI